MRARRAGCLRRERQNAHHTVAGFGANGVLGSGYFRRIAAKHAFPRPRRCPYINGCSAAGTCSAENAALAQQVANVVAQFAADNNGVIINLPNW